jgi:hypothetical protein
MFVEHLFLRSARLGIWVSSSQVLDEHQVLSPRVSALGGKQPAIRRTPVSEVRASRLCVASKQVFDEHLFTSTCLQAPRVSAFGAQTVWCSKSSCFELRAARHWCGGQPEL